MNARRLGGRRLWETVFGHPVTMNSHATGKGHKVPWTDGLDQFVARASSGESMLRARAFRAVRRFATQGADCRFGRGLIIRGGGRIGVGNCVVLTDYCWLNAVIEGDGSGVAIAVGDGTAMGRRCVVSAVNRVKIGANVLMAPGVFVTDHFHAFEDPHSPVIVQSGLVGVAPVTIGEGTWLGYNAVVMPGVSVGRNAVVGANSVVTHDVPDGAVVAGSPARVLRVRHGSDGQPR